MDKKDIILNNINMIDILDKYNIKRKGYMFHCCFHGKDKNASAKAYKNSYYCFACNCTGDLIDFVQRYFNLSFREAMEKINIDFNLGLKLNEHISKEKLKQLEKQRLERIRKRNIINEKIKKACSYYYIYKKSLNSLKSSITLDNWEDVVPATIYLEEYLNKLELYTENLANSIDK